MVSSLVYLRYSQSLERATWIFLLGSLIALGGSAALAGDNYIVPLIFLAVTPVKFGLILSWRQCLKFTALLVLFYATLASWQLAFGGASFTDAMHLVTFGTAAMGAGLSTTAYAYRTKRASMKLEQKNKEIARLALEDPLTGIPNRRAFNEIANDNSETAASNLLAIIDLDNFKSINDQFGHDVGDEVLLEFASRLSDAAHGDSSVYRLGGDEFVMIACEKSSSVDEMGLFIRQITTAPIVTSAGEIPLEASVGIAKSRFGHANPKDLFRDADIAVYEAKRKPGSTWVVFSKDLRPAKERIDLLKQRLRQAIETNEIDVAFQPQFQVNPKAIIGFESLARWQTQDLGPVSPGEFVPIAEASNLIVQLDRAVMQRAISLAQNWLLPDQRLSMNVSGATLLSNDFVEFLERTVFASRINLSQIQIEITETQILDNKSHAIEVCQKLRALGISIALDDFGTGYSSLSYLSSLPVNVLKIDRSFVQGSDCESNLKIMRSIVGLANSMGLRIMIEGVERSWQLDVSKQLGCNFVQGFYFSRPLNSNKCADLNSRSVRPVLVSELKPSLSSKKQA